MFLVGHVKALLGVFVDVCFKYDRPLTWDYALRLSCITMMAASRFICLWLSWNHVGEHGNSWECACMDLASEWCPIHRWWELLKFRAISYLLIFMHIYRVAGDNVVCSAPVFMSIVKIWSLTNIQPLILCMMSFMHFMGFVTCHNSMSERNAHSLWRWRPGWMIGDTQLYMSGWLVHSITCQQHYPACGTTILIWRVFTNY